MLLGGLSLTAGAVQAQARQARPQPTSRAGQSGAGSAGAEDTARTLSKDTRQVEWATPDSAMRALLDKDGYRKVRYQGDTMKFNAASRLLVLKGKPSLVQREETMLAGDSIAYDDSTKRVVATGDTVLLRDPEAQDADDFLANGRIEYDLETRQGTTGAFSTSVVSGQRLFLTAETAETLRSGAELLTLRVPDKM